MKVDVTTELKTLAGDVLIENEKPVALKNIIINALLFPKEEDTGKLKAKKYTLAVKTEAASDVCEYDLEDVVLIKDLIGEFFTTLIVGQCYELLDK